MRQGRLKITHGNLGLGICFPGSLLIFLPHWGFGRNSIFLPTRNGFFAYPLQNRLLSLLLGSNLCGEVLDQTHSGEQNLCHSRATANPFQVAMAAQQSLSLVMCDIVPSILARNIVQH
jgi:hypothetical protein